jgi:hypothetical protein
MATTIEPPISYFIKEQVEKGNARTEREAETNIIKAIEQREIQRRIGIGRQEVREGKTKPLDDVFVDNLKARIINKINSNQNL